MTLSIDVRKLNAQKKYAGDLQFEFEGDPSYLVIPFVSFSSPVRASIHYEILEDDSVELTGSITFSVKGSCSRCLTETEHTFSGEVEAYFVTRNAESEDYVYSGGVIHLQDCFNDALMLAMPSALVCSDACVPLTWNGK